MGRRVETVDASQLAGFGIESWGKQPFLAN